MSATSLKKLVMVVFSLLWLLVRQYSIIWGGGTVSILDVGQGDGIFLRKDDFTMLIDGGPDVSVVTELASMMPSWDREIDVVLLTHAHDDHILGLVDVFSRFRVNVFLIRIKECVSRACGFLLGVCGERKVPIVDLDQYTVPLRIERGDNTLVLWWMRDSKLSDNLNNTSVVTIINNEKHRFSAVLTGDLELDGEREFVSFMRLFPKLLIKDGFTLLKAGHHCSRTASSSALVDVVAPEVVVCSVGAKNKFGHPHNEILELFMEKKIMMLRTDQNGSVTYFVDKGVLKEEI